MRETSIMFAVLNRAVKKAHRLECKDQESNIYYAVRPQAHIHKRRVKLHRNGQ